MFEFFWVQTIFWGYIASEARVLLNSCEKNVLHGFEVHLTGVSIQSCFVSEGFLIIKKRKKKERLVSLEFNLYESNLIGNLVTHCYFQFLRRCYSFLVRFIYLFLIF